MSTATTSLSIPIGSPAGWPNRAAGSVSRRSRIRCARPAKSGTRGDGVLSAAMVLAMAADTAAMAATPSVVAGCPLASRRLTYASVGAVISVITGTSVIANAPLSVWIARCMRSSARCGEFALASSQPSMVTRWPITSVSRISSSTASMDAGMPASSTSANASSAVSAGSSTEARTTLSRGAS